jgi:Flp pilus assembly protein TadD
MSEDNLANHGMRVSYSNEEQLDIYALAKMSIETGQLKRAELILRGLTTVAPEFLPGWLGLSVVKSSLGEFEPALEAAKQAVRVQNDSPAGLILVVVNALTLGDRSTAGTYLGELKDMIDQGIIVEPNIIRLFKMQMVRYHGE